MGTIYRNGIQYSGSGEPLIYDDMGGATSTTDGVHGLVPAPMAGDQNKVLMGSGTWENLPTPASELDDLDDVEITSPANGDILKYDPTSQKWVNGEGSAAVTKEASGNPIEITDGANAPLVKCVTAIQGNQDLHGYDKPWIGGAGKNKLPLVLSDIKALNTSGTWSGNDYTWNGITFSIITDNGENITGINVNGTASALSYLFLQNATSDFSVFAGKSCILNGCPANGSTSTYTLSTYGSGMTTNDVGSGTNVTFPSTTPNAWNIAINIISGYTANNLKFYPMLRLSTVSDPTFTPYSNICPITAYTEGEIEVRGKNLYNGTPYMTGYGLNQSGEIVESSNYNLVRFLSVGNSFTLSARDSAGSSVNASSLRIATYDASGSLIDVYGETHQGDSGATRHSVSLESDSGAKYVYASFRSTCYDVQFELGPTATDYEPYVGTTHTATFSQSIYQGNADFVGGEATADMMLCDLSDLTWNYNSEYDLWVSVGVPTGYKTTSTLVAELYPYVPTLRTNGTEYGIRGNQQYNLWCRNYDSVNAPSGMMAYELATPTTETITPTNLPIKSLNGYSHIESSTGDMEIEYITGEYQPLVDLIQSSKHVYSTAEQIVGTWVDGSTVYEKVYLLSTQLVISNNNWTDSGISKSGLDLIIGAFGIDTNDKSKYELNGYLGGSGSEIQLQACRATSSAYINILVIRYTKTTATRSLSRGGEELTKGEPIEEKETEEVNEK